MQRIGRRGAKRKFGRVGAADNDGAGPCQVLDEGRVLRRNHIREGRNAIAGRLALLVDIDLDGDRDAVQRAHRTGLAQRGIKIPRALNCLVPQIVDHGIQVTVHVPHAGHGGGHGRLGRCVAFGDLLCELARAQLPDWSVCHVSGLPLAKALPDRSVNQALRLALVLEPSSRDNNQASNTEERRRGLASFCLLRRCRLSDGANALHGAPKVRRRLFAGIASVATGASPADTANSETVSTDV